MENEITSGNTLPIGYILLPYIMRHDATMINGDVVWYRNKFKNLLLKIKHFFVKSKYLKHPSLKYHNRPVNPNYYKTFKINNDND